MGRKKLNNEINIVRLLRTFREHKLVVKSLIDPSKYNKFKQESRYKFIPIEEQVAGSLIDGKSEQSNPVNKESEK